jgi:hypothetical protein
MVPAESPLSGTFVFYVIHWLDKRLKSLAFSTESVRIGSGLISQFEVDRLIKTTKLFHGKGCSIINMHLDIGRSGLVPPGQITS